MIAEKAVSVAEKYPDRIPDDANKNDLLTDAEKDAIGEIGNISMGTAATTLFSLVNRKVDISTPPTTHDIDMITEQVRGALGRTITRKFCENGQLRVVTLDAELEKKVLAALTKNEHGVYLALSPDIVQQIVQQVGELRKKFEELSQTPILLTSQIIP